MDGWWLDWADLYRPPGLGNVAVENQMRLRQVHEPRDTHIALSRIVEVWVNSALYIRVITAVAFHECRIWEQTSNVHCK